MAHNAFLFPEAILDTPRLFTAIAEWLAIFVYFNICRRRIGRRTYIIYCVISALTMILFQFVAGLLPIAFWVIMMTGAVGLMYLFLFMVLDIMPMDCGVITVHAFVLAEFTASVYRQLYVWVSYRTGKDSFLCSTVMMILIYAVVYGIYYQVESGNIHKCQRAYFCSSYRYRGIYYGKYQLCLDKDSHFRSGKSALCENSGGFWRNADAYDSDGKAQ